MLFQRKLIPANEKICTAFMGTLPKGFNVDVEANYLIITDSNGKKVVDLEFDKNGAIACAPKRKVGF